MSQWGIEKTIEGARFIPLVCTKGFAPMKSGDIIEDILCIHSGGDQVKASHTLGELKSKYLRQPYVSWLR